MCEICGTVISALHGSDESKAEKLRAETELELARIHKAEAIELAKIARQMNEDDNEAALVESETEAEVLSGVVEDLTAPEENNIIVTSEDTDLDGEPVEEEDELAEEPPVVEPEPVSHKSSGWNYWG